MSQFILEPGVIDHTLNRTTPPGRKYRALKSGPLSDLVYFRIEKKKNASVKEQDKTVSWSDDIGEAYCNAEIRSVLRDLGVKTDLDSVKNPLHGDRVLFLAEEGVQTD